MNAIELLNQNFGRYLVPQTEDIVRACFAEAGSAFNKQWGVSQFDMARDDCCEILLLCRAKHCDL